MTRPALLLTRPEAEQARSIAAAEAAGFEAVSAPLLQIRPVEWSLPTELPDALLFTSARAPEIAAMQLAAMQLKGKGGMSGKPRAYAVGRNTAEAAQRAGFEVLATGDGNGTAIAERARADGNRRLLHLAGETVSKIEAGAGLKIERVTIYTAQPAGALPEAVELRLREGRIFAVLVFSARTARIFSQLSEDACIDRSAMGLVALSEAVAEAAGQGWRAIAVAGHPRLDAAMAAARLLWQDLPHG